MKKNLGRSDSYINTFVYSLYGNKTAVYRHSLFPVYGYKGFSDMLSFEPEILISEIDSMNGERHNDEKFR